MADVESESMDQTVDEEEDEMEADDESREDVHNGAGTGVSKNQVNSRVVSRRGLVKTGLTSIIAPRWG